MPTLLDWNALELKMAAYISQSGNKKDSPTALMEIVLEYALSLDPEEVDDSITDGSSDRGVDAVYVDSRDGQNCIHIFQFKHVETFAKSKRNFPSSEIDKLLSFISDVLEERASLKKSCNPLLWSKVQEIWEALKHPDPLFVIHLAGNLMPLISTERNRLEEGISKYESFSVREHSVESIVAMFKDRKTPRIDAALTIVDMNYFERTDGNIRGLIGTVEADQIISLITDPRDSNQVRDAVFNDNVRVYLKRKNQINRKIIASAVSSQNSEFWYLNNGITITCDSFSYQAGRRAPIVQIKNVQIVNGGQTSHALFEAKNDAPEAIRRVLVLVRIYETKTKEISAKIAESTNSQTPINTRDLRSNDGIQKTLEEGFVDLNLYYERKAKQHADRPREKRVDALAAGQAYLAYFLWKPDTAKKDRARVFGDLYEEVFSEDITPQRLYVPLKVLGVIEDQKRELQRQIRREELIDPSRLFLVDGAYHVLYCVYKLTEVRKIDPLEEKAVKALVNDAIEIIANLVERESGADPTFAFNRFFKDPRTRLKIDEVLSKGGILKRKKLARDKVMLSKRQRTIRKRK